MGIFQHSKNDMVLKQRYSYTVHKYVYKYCLKMCVFSSFLNILKSEAFLRSSGKLFQTHGTVNVKALSPYVFNFDEGTTASSEFDYLSFLIGSYNCVNSEIYSGLVPFNGLKHIVSIL